MIETKAREPLLEFPDDHLIDDLSIPAVELTPEQRTALAEAQKRDQQRQQEWAAIVQALEDNSMAVFRAMRRGRNESEQEQVERVLTGFEDGRFLIDRMGAETASTRTSPSCSSICDGSSGTSTARGRRPSC
jgi:hypothetical protein